MADVSVIVPAYQAAGSIGACLSSIAAQTVRPKEVILVDDGSTDGTVEAAQAIPMGVIELKIFRQENLGAGAARNWAIKESSGTYLAFLDADDQWLPEKLEKSLPPLEAGECDLVCHNFTIQDGKAEALGNSAQHLPKGADPFLAIFLRGFVATSTVVTRRELVVQAGGFDPSLRAGQDYDLWIAMAAEPGMRFVVLNESLSLYHINPQGITSAVERRMQAGLRIMARQAGNLKGRAASPRWMIIKRMAIIHFEAASAHCAQGSLLTGLWTLGRGGCHDWGSFNIRGEYRFTRELFRVTRPHV